MKKKNAPINPETNTNQKMSAELRLRSLIRLFKLEYSLKYNKVTEFTTPLGYFHDRRLVVAAPDVNEAIKTLKLWHDDGTPEAIKTTYLGRCVMWFNDKGEPQP